MASCSADFLSSTDRSYRPTTTSFRYNSAHLHLDDSTYSVLLLRTTTDCNNKLHYLFITIMSDANRDRSKHTIGIFDGRDFGTWEYQVKTYIYEKGWNRVLKPTAVLSLDEDTNEKAWGFIAGKLDKQHYTLFAKDCEGDGQKLWKKLSDHYQKVSVIDVANVRDMLSSMRLKSGESMESYIGRLTECFDRLTSQKEVISDAQKFYYLSKGLPREYDAVTTTMKVAGTDYATAIKQVSDQWSALRLNTERDAMSDREPTAVKSETANYVHYNRGNYGRGGFRGGFRGRGAATYQPAPFGHYNNRQQGQYQGSSSSNNNNSSGDRQRNYQDAHCTNCGNYGHTNRICYSSKPSSSSTNQNVAYQGSWRSGQQQHIAANVNNTTEQAMERGDMTASEYDEAMEHGIAYHEQDIHYSNDNAQDNAYHTAAVESKPEQACLSNGTSADSSWVLDTGATSHFTKDKKLLYDVSASHSAVSTADGNITRIACKGKAALSEPGNGKLTLLDVGYAPSFAKNLMSVSRFTDKGQAVVFLQDRALVVGANDVCWNGTPLFTAARAGNLYVYGSNKHSDNNEQAQHVEAALSVNTSVPTTANKTADQLLHERFGHMGDKVLSSIVGKKVNSGQCDACLSGKLTRKHFKTHSAHVRADGVLGRLMFDLSGPIDAAKLMGEDPPAGLGYTDARYLSVIIDEHSNMMHGKLLASKADTFALHIKPFIEQAENVTGKRVKAVHSDGGGEYTSLASASYFRGKGIAVTTTVANTPQHNGTVERANRTIFDMVRTLLQGAGLSVEFWTYAALWAIDVLNHRIQQSGVSSMEMFSGRKPDLDRLHAFGCDVWYAKMDGHKLEQRGRKGVFLGYDASKRDGAVVYDADAERVVITRDVRFEAPAATTFNAAKQVRTNAVPGVRLNQAFVELFGMDEDSNASVHAPEPEQKEQQQDEQEEQAEEKEEEKKNGSESSIPPSEAQRDDAKDVSMDMDMDMDVDDTDGDVVFGDSTAFQHAISTSSEQQRYPNRYRNQPDRWGYLARQQAAASNVPAGGRYPNRKRNQPDRWGNKVNYEGDFEAPVIPQLLNVNDVDLNAYAHLPDPKNYAEAMASPDKHLWLAAMQRELTSLNNANTWSIVQRPRDSNVNVMGCTWVLKKKRNKDGSIAEYKARLVAQGFTQRYGVDYFDTYSPTLRFKSLNIVLSMVASMDYELRQMDVVSAFLHATMKEEAYMRQPQGFEQEGNVVCKLNKTIYGTKQASMEWNQTFNQAMVQGLGFKRCVSDSCVYVKRSKTGRAMYLLLFVDDILFAFHPADVVEHDQYVAQLSRRFQMKTLGDAEWILGMRIVRDRTARTIHMDQHQYIEKLLERFGMQDCAGADTPAAVMQLTTNEKPVDEKLRSRHQEAVGSLLYAAICTRPDIMHAVVQVSKHNANPSEQHWVAVKRIMRYLRRYPNIPLTFGAHAALASQTISWVRVCTRSMRSVTRIGLVTRVIASRQVVTSSV